ncbi:MAG: polymer-forming cytoskeletal protein [Firmicutes bacterium]|nr:polymer-forming cytoskeletal protein [Bacillota bacterium]
MRRRDVKPAPDQVETIIGRNTTFQGVLQSAGAVRVEGRVQGEIRAEGDVYVTETAVVEAQIHGRQVAIAGEVRGDVHAAARLDLVGTGKLVGDFYAPKIVVAEGATFEGRSHMTGLDAAAGEAAAAGGR